MGSVKETLHEAEGMLGLYREFRFLFVFSLGALSGVTTPELRLPNHPPAIGPRELLVGRTEQAAGQCCRLAGIPVVHPVLAATVVLSILHQLRGTGSTPPPRMSFLGPFWQSAPMSLTNLRHVTLNAGWYQWGRSAVPDLFASA